MRRTGPKVRALLVERAKQGGRLVDGRLDLAIEAEGRLIGEIDARAPEKALPPGVFELGVAIFDPGERGKGYGTEAISLLTTYLFEQLGAERVQASTAVWNVAMRRVFARLGFPEEGVLRGFMPADGGRDDYVMVGVTKAGWGKVAP